MLNVALVVRVTERACISSEATYALVFATRVTDMLCSHALHFTRSWNQVIPFQVTSSWQLGKKRCYMRPSKRKKKVWCHRWGSNPCLLLRRTRLKRASLDLEIWVPQERVCKSKDVSNTIKFLIPFLTYHSDTVAPQSGTQSILSMTRFLACVHLQCL